MGLSQHPLLFGPLLLIYQMPKVGSQTVEASVRQAELPHSIFRLHYLSKRSTRTLRRGLRAPDVGEEWKRDARNQLNLQAELSRAIRFRKYLRLLGVNVPKVEIITGVRELIGLALSAVFENYQYFAPTPEGLTIEVCRDALLHPKTCKPLRAWFDNELKRTTGFDVYTEPFPREKQYAVYENRNARVLLYRFEALDRLPAMLQEFLGCRIPAVLNQNVAESKSYAELYRRMKSRLRLPREFVREQVSCRLMRHFYSEQERQRFELQWSEAGVESELLCSP